MYNARVMWYERANREVAVRIRMSLLFILGVVLLAGCVGTASDFTDDFSDPSSGWGASSHETYVRGYQQGRYLMQIDVPQWLVWATAGRTYHRCRDRGRGAFGAGG